MNSHLLRLFATVVALLTGLGCSRPSKTNQDTSLISFARVGSGTLYFTDAKGAIWQTTSGDSPICLLRDDESLFHSLAVSADGARLAVVAKLKGEGKPQSVRVYSVSSESEIELMDHFPGSVPCFSRDGTKLYFCRAVRYVKPSGFGGGFWTDYQLWQRDFASRSEVSLSRSNFFQIDDLAHDPDRDRIFFSATISQANGVPCEHLFQVNIDSGIAKQLSQCASAHVCAGDPGLSPAGDYMAFVSDRVVPYHYGLFVKEMESGEDQAVDTGIRFVAHPEFAANSNSILALGANTFSFDGQPQLELYEIVRGKPPRTVVSNAWLSGSKSVTNER